jgi:hypothetical protein
MARESVPRVRLVAIPDEAVLVVRGDELEPTILRADAERFHRRFDKWGRYGVFAFGAVDLDEVEVLCETRLQLFETVVIFQRSDLARAGIEVVPTFRRPHVTLAHPDLDALVTALLSCEHRVLNNRHFERDEKDS